MSDSTENNEFCFERLSRENIKDLDKLHTAVYGKAQPSDYFVKKYDTAYTGVEHTGYIAYNDKHQPAAFYGVIPCVVRFDEQLFLAAQSADTMTHPKYQYKGLFVKLANCTYKLCKDLRINFIFGFPNQNSLHGFLVKLSWRMTETMACYIVPVSTISIESAIRKLPFLTKMYSKYRTRVLKNYLVPQKGIENSVFKDDFGGLNRNAHYLNYKAYSDTQVIKIGDALLWVKFKNGLIVGDISCRQEDFGDMMIKVKKLAFKLGLKEIQFHTSHQTTLSDLFSARYEAISSFHVIFKNLGDPIALDRIKFTFADVDIF